MIEGDSLTETLSWVYYEPRENGYDPKYLIMIEKGENVYIITNGNFNPKNYRKLRKPGQI